MKRKLALLLLALCVVLVISGCGNKNLPQNSNGDEPNQPSKSTGKVDRQQSTTNLKTIGDFFEAWNKLYDPNEMAINSYDDPIFELVVPAVDFLTGVQYDMLNLQNLNGRFEGKLPLAGFPGFVDRDGAKMTFGYKYVREEDGWAPSMRAGDLLIENGNCDLAKETYQTEKFTKRNEKIVERTYTEFKRIKNGAMICIRISSSSENPVTGEEEMVNTFTLLIANKDSLDFVIGKANTGPAFRKLSIMDKSDFTKELAIGMVEAAEYEIDKSGSVIDGVLLVDP